MNVSGEVEETRLQISGRDPACRGRDPAPRWGRANLRKLAFFRVRRLEIRGARYLAPDDVVARLRVDTLRSIIDDVTPLEARLRALPQVAGVEITRKLSGTLVVKVQENLPVALVPRGDGLAAVRFARGRALPIDPSRAALDPPMLTQRRSRRSSPHW